LTPSLLELTVGTVQEECRQFWKDLPTPPTFYYQCNDPLVTEEGLFLFPFFLSFLRGRPAHPATMCFLCNNFLVTEKRVSSLFFDGTVLWNHLVIPPTLNWETRMMTPCLLTKMIFKKDWVGC